jgi:hypothetical protein
MINVCNDSAVPNLLCTFNETNYALIDEFLVDARQLVST